MKITVVKLKTVALIALAMWSVNSFAQETVMYVMKNGEIVFSSPVSDIDSIILYAPASQTYDEGVVINGVKWATRNVGAPGTFTSSPFNYGEYYQWNNGTTNILSYDDYYNSVYVNSDLWLPANDPSPTGWRVPTLAEINTLFDADKVSNEWIFLNGVYGEKFIDRVTGNSIFLPAAGCRSNALYDVGVSGYYWCSTQPDSLNAYVLAFREGSAWSGNYGSFRNVGFSVRSVAG